jgi:hypothetical protein
MVHHLQGPFSPLTLTAALMVSMFCMLMSSRLAVEASLHLCESKLLPAMLCSVVGALGNRSMWSKLPLAIETHQSCLEGLIGETNTAVDLTYDFTEANVALRDLAVLMETHGFETDSSVVQNLLAQSRSCGEISRHLQRLRAKVHSGLEL